MVFMVSGWVTKSVQDMSRGQPSAPREKYNVRRHSAKKNNLKECVASTETENGQQVYKTGEDGSIDTGELRLSPFSFVGLGVTVLVDELNAIETGLVLKANPKG